MAGQFTRLQKSYKIMDADGVKLYHGVTYGADTDECIKPVADNAIPLGVVDNDERVDEAFHAGGDQTGKQVAVKLEGIAMLKMSGTVSVGDRVMLGVGGVGKGLPAGDDAYYNVLGFAEKDGIDGDVVPVRMSYHYYFNAI